ncbi:MAG: hypothetical protein IPJ30_23105 [Acidobacteria bacterium]|nr:hypothetical protein [Acidobacteriota bacterium]
MISNTSERRVAFFGSFDPPHNNLAIARSAHRIRTRRIRLRSGVPCATQTRQKPTSAFHRFAMLALATKDEPKSRSPKMELDLPGARTR